MKVVSRCQPERAHATLGATEVSNQHQVLTSYRSPPMRMPVIFALLLVLSVPVTAQSRDASARRVRVALDSIAHVAVDGGRAAGFVAVAVRGRDTLASVAYGRADVENDAPLSVNHVFQFASITKQFTAAAVLTLVDDGRVALDAPITRYLPDAPVRGQAITVRQLLSHTSGLPDYAEEPRHQALRFLDPPPDSLLALVRDTPLYFAPGEAMRYSNTGFVLLGQLIEKISGRPYAAYVEERVLRPAGAVAHTSARRSASSRISRAATRWVRMVSARRGTSARMFRGGRRILRNRGRPDGVEHRAARAARGQCDDSCQSRRDDACGHHSKWSAYALRPRARTQRGYRDAAHISTAVTSTASRPSRRGSPMTRSA